MVARYVRRELPGTHVVVPALLPTGPKAGDVFQTAYPNDASKVSRRASLRVSRRLMVSGFSLGSKLKDL
jgi:hypothetical protein